MGTDSLLSEKTKLLNISIKEKITKSLRTAKYTLKVTPGHKSFVEIKPEGVNKIESLTNDAIKSALEEFNLENPDYFANLKQSISGEKKTLIEIDIKNKRFSDAANYISREMKINLGSKDFLKIKNDLKITYQGLNPVGKGYGLIAKIGGQLVGRIALAEALITFYNQVKTNAAWDYKNRKEFIKIYGTQANIAIDYEENTGYPIDVWGNIHFGFIGAAADFPLATLQRGAGIAQLASDLKRLKTNLRKTEIEENAIDENITRIIDRATDAEKNMTVSNFDPPEDRDSVLSGFQLWISKGANVSEDDLIQTVRGLTKSKRPIK